MPDTPRKIVIIGGGPAGVGAAMGARAQDAGAEITLLTDEHCEPYEKPPLSKTVLTGKAMPHDAPIAGPRGIAAHNIVLRHGVRATEIDRAGRTVVTRSGERIPYDALVIATGAVNRLLPMFPPGNSIGYLRNYQEALAIKAHLGRGKTLAVIGGGLIGLEVAASAADLGLKVTVIEIAPRLMARVCDNETSAYVLARHIAHGVDVKLGATVTSVRDRAIALSSGEVVEAGLIVVGIGAVPDDALAKVAGLDANDGVIVDECCRTSDPAIFAGGDCTRFPGPHGPVRLENWRHAQEQGTVAGRNAAGGNTPYSTAPSFWSEQYDLYLQGVGWPSANPTAIIRRPVVDSAPMMFEMTGPHIAYALGINVQRDMAAVRRLIERRVVVDANDLADPTRPLANLLKAKT